MTAFILQQLNEDDNAEKIRRPLQYNNELVKQISDVHQRRLIKAAKVMGVKEDKVIIRFISEHRKHGRAAAWLSTIIGESHENYMNKLTRLGEYPTNIR